MKIIEYGDMKRTCMYCGTKVELSLEDIQVHDFGGVKSRFWTCPCCGQEIHNI